MEESIEIELRQYDTAKQQGHSLSTASLSKLLRKLRMSKMRRPDVVLDNWKAVLKVESGSEVWSLYEQICLAALDVGNQKLADECIAQLLTRFPDSVRVGRLVGLQKEQQGEYGDALEIYKGLLTKNPSNLLILKRKACVYKAMGDLKGEVEELNSILRQFPAERSSWQELGEIYLSLCDNEAAAHCFEELILLEPGNAHYHVRLAEAYYSVGDYDRLLLARKHYTISLTRQNSKHNLRGLYGLLYSCLSLTSSTAGGGGDSADSTIEQEALITKELLKWTKEEIQQHVEKQNKTNSPLELVLNALEKQQSKNMK